jgi:hypothetical protein
MRDAVGVRWRRDKKVPPSPTYSKIDVVVLRAEPICACRPDQPLEMLGHSPSILRGHGERRKLAL